MNIQWDQSVIHFRKTKEEWGGLSNMCGGYPIDLRVGVHKYRFRTSEALYQALKFPFNPDIQFQIQEKSSPMAAKMVAKANASHIHPLWLQSGFQDAMTFALKAKLFTNINFLFLLNRTGDQTIVESSHKDMFWGAIPQSCGGFLGENRLGKTLMRIRDDVFSDPSVLDKPLEISRKRYPFALFCCEIPPLRCNYV